MKKTTLAQAQKLRSDRSFEIARELRTAREASGIPQAMRRIHERLYQRAAALVDMREKHRNHALDAALAKRSEVAFELSRQITNARKTYDYSR